jgi:hypothetical protein
LLQTSRAALGRMLLGTLVLNAGFEEFAFGNVQVVVVS